MSADFIFTSDSVTAGHPDKLCDQVSDAIVDRFLMQDPNSSVVAESALSGGVMFISAHYALPRVPDIPEVARKVIREAGYPSSVFDAGTCSILTSFTDHTATDYEELDIDTMTDADADAMTAKHQVNVFGYACKQSPNLMPLPVWLAHRLAQKLEAKDVRKQLPYLLPDGKTQVGIEYKDGKPKRIDGITLVASQTEQDGIDLKRLHNDLVDVVIQPLLDEIKCPADARTRLFVNPEGPLIGGGPSAHSGLTGRKTGIDTYGEYSRHSGTALSGKGPLRIDRIGAYAARYAAKNLVAAGLADEAEVSLSYSVGLAAPVSVYVRSYGTGAHDDPTLTERVKRVFDFRVARIIRDLKLRQLPSERTGGFYRKLAVYGQIGREDLDAPWELTDRVDDLNQV